MHSNRIQKAGTKKHTIYKQYLTASVGLLFYNFEL